MDEIKEKVYVFDLDETLCSTPLDQLGNPIYEKSTPYTKRIQEVNRLYEDGNKIIVDTARGSTSGNNYYELTKNQLTNWGLKFHILRTGSKYASDYYIDDKAINTSDFFKL